MKFKLGDKVRFNARLPAWEGSIGTITYVHPPDSWDDYDVRPDGETYKVPVWEEEIETTGDEVST